MKSHKKVKLAFFDIDGTIFRSSLLIELIDGLVKAKIFPKKAEQEIRRTKLAWLDRVGRYDEYIMKVVEIHTRYIKGCRYEDVIKVVHRITSEQKNRVYRFTRDLTRDLKRKKYHLVAISGSPAYMVSEFAKHLGFNASIGRIIGVKDGKFTGKILNKHILNKRAIVTEFISAQPFAADLKNSIAVGDTYNDIPMLKMVGRPIAFNPNVSFARYAKKNGWEIVVERKDAIFKLKNFEVTSGDARI